MDGGYDAGYRACPCFWGREPGKLVRMLASIMSNVMGIYVLDAGCGEGKNAAFFARLGASVTAIDISELAIAHAKSLWPEYRSIEWQIQDVANLPLSPNAYDVVIAYGLPHCLRSPDEIRSVVSRLQGATKEGGYNAIVALNLRSQDLRAHPELKPCLIDHRAYLEIYRDWRIIVEEDTDLAETHPHNNILHTHSLTRILAKKTSSWTVRQS